MDPLPLVARYDVIVFTIISLCIFFMFMYKLMAPRGLTHVVMKMRYSDRRLYYKVSSEYL